MEKKTQIYLSAFIMYLLVALAGVVARAGSYWFVFATSLLITALVLVTVLTDKETFKATMIEWISVCAFAGIEVALTICIEIINVPVSNFFTYFNYTVQMIGYAFAFYALIRFLISFSHVDEKVKNFLSNRKNKEETVDVEKEEIATKVEETIKEETVVENTEEVDVSDVEVVGETPNESEVIGIELKEVEEQTTPYMEEEL